MSVIAATDLSEHSQAALRWASAYAANLETPLHVAYVIDSLGDDELWTALFETPDEIEHRVLSSAATRVSDFATKALEGAPTPSRRNVLVAIGPPADELAIFADEKEAEVVVCGTSGHGRLRNAVFGSNAYRLTHATKRPTVFVPHGAPLPPAKKLVVPVDFSDCSVAALRWAATVATRWGASITLVHGIGVTALSPDYEPGANFVPMVQALTEQRAEQLRALLRDAGVEGDVVVSRHAPAEAVSEAVGSIGADMVVMGTHGRTAVGRFLLGSVALQVLRETKVAVAAIHAPEED